MKKAISRTTNSSTASRKSNAISDGFLILAESGLKCSHEHPHQTQRNVGRAGYRGGYRNDGGDGHEGVLGREVPRRLVAGGNPAHLERLSVGAEGGGQLQRR